MNRNRILLAAALATAALGAGATAATAAPMPATGKVVSAVDGDTLRVRVAGRVRLVNLAGIEAPFLADRECFAVPARNRLRVLAPAGATVRFAFVGRRPASTANRFTAIVLKSGVSVNRGLVNGGFARAVGSRFASVEIAAQDAARGLWRTCEGFVPTAPTPPAPTTPVPPPPAATPAQTKDQITADVLRVVENKAIDASSTSGGTLDQLNIDLCNFTSGGRQYRERTNTFNATIGSIVNEEIGTWAVTDAAAEQGIKAIQITFTPQDGSAPVNRVIGLLPDGSLRVGQRAATVGTSTVC